MRSVPTEDDGPGEWRVYLKDGYDWIMKYQLCRRGDRNWDLQGRVTGEEWRTSTQRSWGWNSLTREIHSDALSGGRREDRGMSGKDNPCLQARGHSSIRFSLWRGRETRKWRDLDPRRGPRVPQVGAQSGKLPGQPGFAEVSWWESRLWASHFWV